MSLSLTKGQLLKATAKLCSQDADLEKVVKKFGAPPLWNRPEGFRTLIYLILEQQVSLASARATFEKLVSWLGSDPTPKEILLLSFEELRSIGFSRQKISYSRLLSQAVIDGTLSINDLGKLSDEVVKRELMKIKGIGPWTADVYLMEALSRPDVWPTGDLALAVGAAKVKKLASRPNENDLKKLGEQWRPFRSVAARILWHYYLCEIRPQAGEKPS